MQMTHFRALTAYAIGASLYGAARAVAYTREAKVTGEGREIMYTEMAAGTLVSAVVHVMYAPATIIEDAVAIERWVRDIPDRQDSLPFPLNVCFPHGTGRKAQQS